jgi:dipeptidyl aminopeptidase/acylaminoacyl peptidase
MTTDQPRATRRHFLAGVALLPMVGTAFDAARAAAAAYPIEAFFTMPRTVDVVMSPNGERLAALERLGTPEAPQAAIDVIDAADPENSRRRIPLGPTEVQSIAWAGNSRLLVRVILRDTVRGRARIGSNIRADDREVLSRRVLSIDADTGTPVLLFEGERQRLRASADLGYVVDLLPGDDDHILMMAREANDELALHRVNVIDGSSEVLERGTPFTIGWHTQAGVPVIRRDLNARGNLESILARAPGETEWKLVRRNFVRDSPDFSWIGETDRPGVVMVTARVEGEDAEAVRELDLSTLAFGPALQSRAGRDVMHGVLDAASRYVGAAYYGDRLEYEFVEPGMAAHHRALDRFFESSCDVHLTAVDAGRNRFLAFALGPREPGSWYLYDRQARSVVNVGWRHDLAAERLGDAEVLRVQTRDGGQIEAYLTAPADKAPGPLIVLAHGGPEARDLRSWDRQVQILAAQGWWVLQPNFRGSGGYGRSFAEQGWRRWGDLMQHDVEDSVAHAVAARDLDGARVGIMGTSYGGYAALMGAVLRPDLYKAAVGICGVYDLPDMMDWVRRNDDTADGLGFRFWTQRIGDPGTDGARLEAASPRRRTAEINCPVVLVHGVDDGVVPVVQSQRMRDALRSARRSVDYVEVPDAGHADWSDDQELALMRRYVALFRTAFA